MAPKKPNPKAKPAPAPQEEPEVVAETAPEQAPEPQEEFADVTPHIPSSDTPTQPTQAPVAKEETKVRRTDSFDEFLVGRGEAADLMDEPLPDTLALLGRKQEPVIPTETDGYSTSRVLGAADTNLIWYPAIVAGRCELCGATRYVGGEIWKQVNRKTGEFRYVYRGGEWVEIHAANCKHYRNIEVRCSYCGESFTGEKDKLGQFTQVLGERVVWVVADPATPKKLTMVCSDFGCKNKFDEQFHLNNKI